MSSPVGKVLCNLTHVLCLQGAGVVGIALGLLVSLQEKLVCLGLLLQHL